MAGEAAVLVDRILPNIGVHGSLSIDVVRGEAVTLMIGARGDVETYFTGTSRQASAARLALLNVNCRIALWP